MTTGQAGMAQRILCSDCDYGFRARGFHPRPGMTRLAKKRESDLPRPACGRLYNRRMNEKLFSELPAWLTKAGLAGTPDTDIFSGFCDRCVAAGIPLGRAHLFIDTLHPVHEGRLFRWGFAPDETALHDYGRTSVQGVRLPAIRVPRKNLAGDTPPPSV